MKTIVLILVVAIGLIACDKRQVEDHSDIFAPRLPGVLLTVADKRHATDTSGNPISAVSFKTYFRSRDTTWWNDPHNCFHDWPVRSNMAVFRITYLPNVPLVGEYLYGGSDTAGTYGIYYINPALNGAYVFLITDTLASDQNYTSESRIYHMGVDSTTKIRLNYSDPLSSPIALANAYNERLLTVPPTDRLYYIDSL
jgi:hypothetical protein